ncbi:MAG: DedA family protein, partial [Actinobacteria bacterium]|nr:DedA family protein [Actinomycetota bacterium]
MDWLAHIIDFVLHIDVHLSEMIAAFGWWVYVILFLIVLAETGLVIAPFLPGDSLLFAAGIFAARGDLNVWILFVSLSVAAVAGDALNYAVGRYLGAKLFRKEQSRFFKKEYLDRTHEFFEKYGGFTIIIARFVPIVRTFAPFVAGVGRMGYPRFFSYNVVGGVGWVAIFTFVGYFFANIGFVKDHFPVVIVAIVLVS